MYFEDDSAIEYTDIDLGERVRLRISLKTLENKKFIDVRKWLKYPNSDNYVPTKRGLMLSLEDWKRIIPSIESLIKEYSSAKAA